MSSIRPGDRLPWDWYDGAIPDNIDVGEDAYLETAFSFYLYRSRRQPGVRIGRAASTYLGTMFDVGPEGQVRLGEYALVHGAQLVCDASIEIGDHTLISWNVVIMDTLRAPRDGAARRAMLRRITGPSPRQLPPGEAPKPVRIGANVWIGFDACVLPGVTIGQGAIVGARSVVAEDVAPYTIVAGNPAQPIRHVDPGDSA